jgi:uncharacterized protein (DUF1501 family)
MPTRRDFIKQSIGAVSVGFILPKSLLGSGPAAAQPAGGRRVLVVFQFAGGNDALNTVVPFTDGNYQNLRPTLAFKQNQLVDAAGRSTVISDTVGLHPSLTKFKDLYDQGHVAIIREVGYPNQNDSHFTSMDIWGAANPEGQGAGKGWLGKYADLELGGGDGLAAVSLTSTVPKTLTSNKSLVTAFSPATIANFGFKADPVYPADLSKDIALLSANNSRTFPDNSLLTAACRNGLGAVKASDSVHQAINGYHPAVTYPTTPLAGALQIVASLIAGVEDATILYVTIGSFDTHGLQAQQHADLLTQFSEAVSAFYGDLSAHSLADDVLMLEWSEFARRPLENGAKGTDHGGASSIFVFGNPVKGGIYGDPPNLAASALDSTGNNVFKIDFRAVYATILKNWLSTDPRAVLGGDFEDVGFLG